NISEANAGAASVAGPTGLNQKLRHALSGTHNAGGMDSLVGGDHEEALGTELQSSIGNFACAHNIIQRRFGAVLLHDGHVLVGGCVENDMRAMLLEDRMQLRAIANVTNDGTESYPSCVGREFAVNFENGVFVVVEKNDGFNRQACNLAREFRANGTAGTG